MTDTPVADLPAAAPVAVPGTNWPDVANTMLHYAAGACIVAVIALFSYNGKPIDGLLAVALTGAAGAVGFKLSK